MTRRGFLITGMFLLALLTAFILRNVVEQLVIIPLVYLWWLLRLYYSMLPQILVWILLVVVVVFSAVSSLIPEVRYQTASKAVTKPAQGQIEILAEWLNKSQRGGIYYKWLIANRLGKNAREILAQRDGLAVSKKFGRLEGRSWNPSQKNRDYLETGLNGSFAEFPQPRWIWQAPKPTPLDVDPKLVIDYLDDEMETSHNGNRKGI
jgi:hypothetical protein